MRLKGKVTIVTGAGSGFGRGIAIRFAEEGAQVIVADINADTAQAVAAEIGENAVAVAADASPPARLCDRHRAPTRPSESEENRLIISGCVHPAPENCSTPISPSLTADRISASAMTLHTQPGRSAVSSRVSGRLSAPARTATRIAAP